MNEATAESGADEIELFINAVSDEMLEAAACAGPENARAYTLAMCTAQSECPY